MEFLSSDSDDSDKDSSMVIVRPEDITDAPINLTYEEKVNENQYLKTSSIIGEKVFDRANLDKSMIIGGEKESTRYNSPMTKDKFGDQRNLTELNPHKNPLHNDKEYREAIGKRKSLPQPITGDLSDDKNFHNQRFSYDVNRQTPSTDPDNIMSSFSQSHDTRKSLELNVNTKKQFKPVTTEEFDELLRIPIQSTHTRQDIEYGSRSRDNLLHPQYIGQKDNLVDTNRDIIYGLEPQANLQSNKKNQDSRRDTGFGFGSQENLLHSQYINPKQDNLVDRDIRYGLIPQDNLQSNKNKQDTRRDTGFGLESQDNSQYISPKKDDLVDDTRRDIRYGLGPQVNLQSNKKNQRDAGLGLGYQDNSQYISPKKDDLVDDTRHDIRYGLGPQDNLQSNKNIQDTRRGAGLGLGSQDNLQGNKNKRGPLADDTHHAIRYGLGPQDNLQNNNNKQDTHRDTGFGLGYQDNSQYIRPKKDDLVDDTHRDTRYGLGPQVNLQGNINKRDSLADDTRHDIRYGLGPQDNLQKNKNKQDTRRDTGFGLGYQDNSQYIRPKKGDFVDDTRRDIRYG
ncbi:18895_t:CDS:2, partial [Funneliformis geosporum]